MKFIAGIAIFLLITGVATAQAFPKNWAGNWKGELQWFKTGDPVPQKVNMELRIQPGDSTGNWTWHIIYGTAAEDSRPYRLISKDSTATHWVIDELNGIVLDQYWVGERFTGAFTVQQSTIVNSYYMENGKLIAEFYSVGAKPVATTGLGTQEVPSVFSYKIGSYQRAVLIRE